MLVINRDVDADRLSRFASGAAARGVGFRRVPALDAHAPGFPFADHAALIGPHFWGGAQVKPGAVGCFLSHRAAWAATLASSAGRALVCEDDAAFLEGTGRVRGVADRLGDFDVLFANGRLASWCAAVADGAPHLPLARVVARLAARGGPAALGLKAAPGADCYLLTARGAERLLALTAAQRIVCGVDWAILWNALDPSCADAAARAAFPEIGILSEHLAPADPPLAAFVLAAPVADQAGGPSVLRHGVVRPIAELVDASGPGLTPAPRPGGGR